MNATGVTAGLAESNGSLLLGIMRDSLHVTCGLTACTPGSAPGPTLGNEYGKTLPFLHADFGGWPLAPPLKSAHGVVLYSSVAMVGVRAVSFLSRRTRFYFVAPAETLAFWEIMRYAAKQQLSRSVQPT